MPGKKRILRDDILDAAVRVIQQSDTGTLTMRTLAKELGCSTQPIYYEFQNQEKLTEELLLYIKHKYLNIFHMLNPAPFMLPLQHLSCGD